MKTRNSKNSLLRHGFKANAERIASSYREALSLKATDPLCAFELARHLAITVRTPLDVGLSENEARILTRPTSGWSGLRLITEEDNHLIIYNDAQSSGRQQSTVMHELAHIICEHELPEARIVSGHPLALRSYDPAMEREAECLGSTLQLPRVGLLWALKRKMKIREIAEHFLASEDMVNYRVNTTGVKKQLALARAYSNKR